jgi:hypothetical protein
MRAEVRTPMLSQSASHQVERLVPRGLPEPVFFADQRGLQALGRSDEIEAETPLDAQAAIVGRHSLHAGDFDHSVVLDVQLCLAADAAVSAGGTDAFLDISRPDLAAGILFHQGPHRAGLDALAAEDTVRVAIGPVAGRDDLALGAAVAEVDGLVHLDLVAGLDAAAAQDAARKVTHDEGVDVFQRVADRGGAETPAGQPVAPGQFLQTAVAPRRAGLDAAAGTLQPGRVLFETAAVGTLHEAVVVSRRQQQLDHQPPAGDHLGGLRVDHQPGSRRHGAGGDKRTRPLHLHQAHAAGAGGGRRL